MAAPSSWKAWRSVSVAWARIGTEVPAELEELLAGIGATIDAVGGSFTMRHTTVAVTAARTGAASPAFTLSAPGGDAETVRRHGDFVSAEPEDTCPPVRSSHRPLTLGRRGIGSAVSCSGQVDSPYARQADVDTAPTDWG